MEEGRLMQSLLLDFYGETLTDKQRECYDLHYNEDLSLAEIAEQLGISRQGVWDNIRRAEASLETLEEKTGLIARFTELRGELDGVQASLEEIRECSTGHVREVAEGGIMQLERLKLSI